MSKSPNLEIQIASISLDFDKLKQVWFLLKEVGECFIWTQYNAMIFEEEHWYDYKVLEICWITLSLKKLGKKENVYLELLKPYKLWQQDFMHEIFKFAKKIMFLSIRINLELYAKIVKHQVTKLLILLKSREKLLLHIVSMKFIHFILLRQYALQNIHNSKSGCWLS